jgi:hypothetical protein
VERIMKAIAAACFGLMTILAAGTGAADEARARLVGRRMVDNGTQPPILVCRYRTSSVSYEVVAAKASCARYLALGEPAGGAAERRVARTGWAQSPASLEPSR